MNKKIIIALCVCLSILVTACSRNNDVQESETPQSQSVNESSMIENQALISSGLQEVLTDDVVFCVKTYVNFPPDTNLSAKAVETFKHEEVSTYLYIVPRYSGSSITIESMDFDESRNEFVAAGLLFESVCTDDYALLVQADLPEAGPRLRVTVTYENMEAIYTPVYDGRGDTVYPYVKNRVLLDEAPLSEASDKTQTDDIPEKDSPIILFEYNESDPVVAVGTNIHSAFILTEQGKMFYWGEDIRFSAKHSGIEHRRVRIPELYETDVVEFDNAAVIVKKDGTVWYREKIVTSTPIDRLCTSYSNDYLLYIRDNNLISANRVSEDLWKEEIIAHDVLTAIGDPYQLLIHKTDKSLWYIEGEPSQLHSSLNMEEAKLLKENVLKFDANFNMHYYSTAGIITEDGSLWHWLWYRQVREESMIKVMDGVKHVSKDNVYMLAVTDNEDMYLFYADFVPNGGKKGDFTITREKILENVVFASGGESGVAIKDDGTIYYWGNVIGCPDEHWVTTPGYSVCEWQETPIQLTLNQEEADKQGIERMKQLLGKVDDYERLRFLEEYYDYYSTNFPEFFSDDELRKYKK